MKVMIVVTHLLGTGHLARALTLGRAYAAAGDDVRVVSGGMPAPLLPAPDGMLVQLPPVRSNGVDFSRLMAEDGAFATVDYLAARQAMLLEVFAGFGPDILITELFPFGRRSLRHEFRALLDAARARPQPPLVCASIRDILAPPSKAKKAAFAQDMVATYYDAVLVHSDPAFIPLELSWPVSAPLRAALRYTGFVAPPAAGPHPARAGAGEIIVSAGGGDVGGPVYDAALAAAHQMACPMRLLIGGADPTATAARVADLRTRAPAHVTVEPARRDFRQMLNHAAASISLCGYNTALDILQAGTPAVFVPFDEGGEVEQGLRANALAQHAGIATVRRADLSADMLCTALEQVMTASRRTPDLAGFDGAPCCVTLTHEMGAAHAHM